MITFFPKLLNLAPFANIHNNICSLAQKDELIFYGIAFSYRFKYPYTDICNIIRICLQLSCVYKHIDCVIRLAFDPPLIPTLLP